MGRAQDAASAAIMRRRTAMGKRRAFPYAANQRIRMRVPEVRRGTSPVAPPHPESAKNDPRSEAAGPGQPWHGAPADEARAGVDVRERTRDGRAAGGHENFFPRRDAVS